MESADRFGARGEREILALGFEALVEGDEFEFGLAGGDRGGEAILEAVQGGACNLALLGAHAAEFAHQQRDAALLAEFGDAYCFECGLVARRSDRLRSIRLDFLDLIVDSHAGLVRWSSGRTGTNSAPRLRSELMEIGFGEERELLEGIDSRAAFRGAIEP
jgi:hypothetical protein